MTTKAISLGVGTFAKKRSRASSPPAEAPRPTIGGVRLAYCPALFGAFEDGSFVMDDGFAGLAMDPWGLYIRIG